MKSKNVYCKLQYLLIIGLKKGKIYIIFFLCILAPPAKPEGPFTASDINGDELTLSWGAPKDDGGEKISNYIIEKKKKGSPKWSKVTGTAKEPTCQVRNLEPGTEYEFRVMAENAQGISEPLETDKAILAKLPYGKCEKH